MKKYIYLSLFALLIGSFASCSDDKLGETIFPTTDETLDSTSYTYPLDCFLRDNYLNMYNMRFIYKMEDISTDMNYNLIPCRYERAKEMAVLVKYLWFDVYNEVAGTEFLKDNAPKIIHLIGSAAIDPTNRVETVGLSEGGLKVSLFKVNALDANNVEALNNTYFQTMHHEFAHILSQKQTYPREFDLISPNDYDATKWQKENDSIVASKGFVSKYSTKENREDFAEIMSSYIVSSDQDWARLLNIASYGWEIVTKKTYADIDEDWDYIVETTRDSNTGSVMEYKVVRKTISRDANDEPLFELNEAGEKVYTYIDSDGIDGKSIIEKKLSIISSWMKEAWGVDLDKLRAEVQKRQANLDIKTLLEGIDKYQPANN